MVKLVKEYRHDTQRRTMPKHKIMLIKRQVGIFQFNAELRNIIYQTKYDLQSLRTRQPEALYTCVVDKFISRRFAMMDLIAQTHAKPSSNVLLLTPNIAKLYAIEKCSPRTTSHHTKVSMESFGLFVYHIR